MTGGRKQLRAQVPERPRLRELPGFAVAFTLAECGVGVLRRW